MSSSCRPKPKSFRSDIHRLLQAAEAGQKADVLTYFSGHLGPRSLNQSQPHMDTKQCFWKMPKSQEETPNPLTVQQKRTKTLTYVQDKAMKEFPSEFTTSTTAVESELSESRQAQASDHASHADEERRGYFRLPNTVHRSLNFVPFQLSALSQKTQHFLSNPEGKQQGLNNEDQLKTKQWFGRESGAKQDPWVGINVAAMHERKLHKGLKKLSAQSWPSRDRLAVFSDVFDDVCECSPVFGRILREIKTDYDLYVNHLMATQSPPPHDMVLNPSLEGFGNGKVREMEMEDAEKEICRLELEARRALKENKRVRKELQKVPAFTDPMDSGMLRLQDTGASIRHTNSVQLKRLQVLDMWREIQQLEAELKEKLVPNDTTTATERRIKDLKTETLRLIALNDRLKTNNQKLENKINMVLEGEKSSKTIRRAFWDKIQCDLWTKR